MSDSPQASANPTSPAGMAGRDRLLGLGLIGASFVVALALSLRAKESVMPRLATPPAAPTTEGLTGFPAAVAPLGLIGRARQVSLRDQLVGMSLAGVKADGTLDVSQGGSARYVFRSLEGQGPEPAREYGELAARKYCGFQSVVINQAGLGAEPDVSDADCRRAIEALPAPGCTLQAVWELGKQKGADPAQTATVEYYRSSAGPAWFFQSGSVTMWIGEDCQKALTPEEGRGVSGKRVPG